MSNKPRRRVIISSDEDSDAEQDKKSNVSNFSSEDDEEVVNDSVVAESDAEDEVVDESVVAASDDDAEGTPSTPALRTVRGASLVASTPNNKQNATEEHALNETFDLMSIGERSAASRSVSNSSVDTSDRERSFHGKEVEESPISKRLNAQADLKSKQALRERLLRKQAIAARGSGDSRDSSDRSSLVNSTLSPISVKPIPYQKDDDDSTRSSRSEMDTGSPLNKSSSSTIPPVSREASMSGESEASSNYASASSGDGSRSEDRSMDSSRGSSSAGTDKENEGKKIVRKKLDMDLAAVKKEKEEDEKVRKFMTPRKVRSAKIEDSDEEEEDVKTDAYPNIESDEENEVKKEEESVVEISDDSDEEQDVKKGDATFDVYDSESEEMMPRLKKEVKAEEDAIYLTSSPARSSKTSVSTSSMASSTGLHPTTAKTHTEDDVKAMEKDLARMMTLLDRPDMKLPDGGALLRKKIEELTTKIENARLAQPARRVAPPEVKGRLQVIDAPKDVDQYNKVVVDDGLAKKKLTGGVMTDDRVENVKRITNDTLDKMHKEVTSQPDDVETPTPRGLRVDLMRHQKTGLTWMLWREKQAAPGGILADDMGLGKTLSMISLMLHAKNDRLEKENEEDEKYERMQKRYKEKCAQANLVPSHTTLVITPASVIFQWEAEINKRVKGSRLSVHVFHGPKTKREDRAKKLAKYDIVITTYNIITSELTEKVNLTNDSDDESESDEEDGKFGKKAAVAKDKAKTKVSKSQISVLTKVHWDRIILDEAHQIKNRNSLISKAVCRLPGRNKWCLTGTPVHNNLFDLFSLVRFLKVHPFDELTLWKDNIMTGKNGAARLNTLVKSLLLRRMKNQVDTVTNKPLVALAPKNYEVHELALEGLEMGIYRMMFNAVQTQVKGFIDAQKDKEDIELFGRARRKKADKNKDGDAEPVVNPFLSGPREVDQKDKFQAMSCILVLLLRLRQAAVHLALTKEALDLSTFEGLSMDTNDEILDAELSQLSLDETEAEEKKGKVATAQDIDKMFSKRYLSTKVRILLDKLDHAVESGDKCVVVSQWTSILSIIEHHIVDRGIEYTQITGEIATADRQERVDSFNRVGGGAQVMLLSLTAGGVGLNLVGGNHLFLVDLHWNPALEAQACDRIYRMGQTKNVFIHKLVAKHTIEETILALQERKSALAKSVLEGAASKALNKLSIADLEMLFDLNGEQKRKEQLEEAAAKAQQKYPNGAAAAAAARAAAPPPPLAVHSTAALNYRNAVYGSAQKGGKPDVITL